MSDLDRELALSSERDSDFARLILVHGGSDCIRIGGCNGGLLIEVVGKFGQSERGPFLNLLRLLAGHLFGRRRGGLCAAGVYDSRHEAGGNKHDKIEASHAGFARSDHDLGLPLLMQTCAVARAVYSERHFTCLVDASEGTGRR